MIGQWRPTVAGLEFFVVVTTAIVVLAVQRVTVTATVRRTATAIMVAVAHFILSSTER